MSKISDWAMEIIKRDEKCVVCKTKKDLEAHHVFHVNPKDKIYYDINNGVTLCNDCHNKYHELYGVDCSIKNLLDLQRRIGGSNTKRLKKENKRLKKVIRCIQNATGDSE